MPRKTKQIISVDVEILKEVLGKPQVSWWQKTLSGLLLGNVGLMAMIAWGIVNDHFTIKKLVDIASIHTQELGIIKTDAVNLKQTVTIHDEKIKNIENKRR